jgi:hypothetical protein
MSPTLIFSAGTIFFERWGFEFENTIEETIKILSLIKHPAEVTCSVLLPKGKFNIDPTNPSPHLTNPGSMGHPEGLSFRIK